MLAEPLEALPPVVLLLLLALPVELDCLLLLVALNSLVLVVVVVVVVDSLIVLLLPYPVPLIELSAEATLKPIRAIKINELATNTNLATAVLDLTFSNTLINFPSGLVTIHINLLLKHEQIRYLTHDFLQQILAKFNKYLIFAR